MINDLKIIPDLFISGFKKNDSGVISAVKRNGEWLETSPEQFLEKVRNVALGLHTLGVERGDKVSIHSENSTEWLIIDQAVLSIGAVLVPIYTTQPGDQITYILENSETKVHIVSNDEMFAETKALIKKVECVKAIVSLQPSKHKKLKSFTDLIESGDQKNNQEPKLFDEILAEVKEDDLATLIYTSGTTGLPKGVMLTHKNIVTNALAAKNLFPFKKENLKDPKVLSYLPLAHIFERMAAYMYGYLGLPIYYIEDVEEIKTDFAVVKPIYFVTVPRLLEKIVTGIKVKGQEMSGIKKQLYYWAVNMAEEYDPEKKESFIEKKKRAIADKLIYSKIRELFGGKLIGMNVGGAALSPPIARFINGIGLYCGLGYGLTETSPVLTGPPPGELRIGSSGKALEGIQLRIAEDGEIQAKGDSVTSGYYKMPEKTKEVFTEDGWFCTGDIGRIDEDGWLFITDRKKSMFKLSTGKYVAPQPIENALVTSGFIDQAIVIGYEKKFCSALIVPSWDNIEKRFITNGYEFPKTDRITNKHVIDRIQKEVNKVNKSLPHWEKVKKFALIEKPFSIESGEITPTLKLKRSIIKENYKAEIDGIYQD